MLHETIAKLNTKSKIARNLLVQRTCDNCRWNFENRCLFIIKGEPVEGDSKPLPEDNTCVCWLTNS